MLNTCVSGAQKCRLWASGLFYNAHLFDLVTLEAVSEEILAHGDKQTREGHISQVAISLKRKRDFSPSYPRFPSFRGSGASKGRGVRFQGRSSSRGRGCRGRSGGKGKRGKRNPASAQPKSKQDFK